MTINLYNFNFIITRRINISKLTDMDFDVVWTRVL